MRHHASPNGKYVNLPDVRSQIFERRSRKICAVASALIPLVPADFASSDLRRGAASTQ